MKNREREGERKNNAKSEYFVVVDVEFQQFSINKIIRRNLYTST